MPGIQTPEGGERLRRVRERLRLARELLGQGRPGEAGDAVEDALGQRAGWPKEDVVDSCGLSARLLALRGERVRAGLMADLAVALACTGTAHPCQAYALLDQAYTLRTLGEGERARACLRAAQELAPGDVPTAAWWEEFARAS
jgi:hypothetical protein